MTPERPWIPCGSSSFLDLIVFLRSGMLRMQLLKRIKARDGILLDELGLKGIFQEPSELGLFEVSMGATFYILYSSILLDLTILSLFTVIESGF